jgi:hypothetical protein
MRFGGGVRLFPPGWKHRFYVRPEARRYVKAVAVRKDGVADLIFLA